MHRCYEAAKLIEQIHAGVCSMHMNVLTLAKKILRAGYYLITMEHDCCKFVQRCHKCQVHGDLFLVPPYELHVMSSPWPFVAWRMNVIGPIVLAVSNGYKFILVAIDYFTKFGVPESIVTNNGANLNSHLMRDICAQFKITHWNSTSYRPQINGVNVYWSYPILTDVWTRSRHAIEVDIPSLRIIQEAELSNAEWVRKRIDQLTLIDQKIMVSVCHGKLYRQRIICAFHKRVKAKIFEIGQLVLKRIFPHQDEYKGKLTELARTLNGSQSIIFRCFGPVGNGWHRMTETDQLKCCLEILCVKIQFALLVTFRKIIWLMNSQYTLRIAY
ncbi:uncharacterized protein LOC107030248 [Solanum pennellii]|uniref:Uncharacterized protein LOC107030248 n=1 Tax=Solanum pennellii TaxID=28526 RepID=A0ABM1HL45_SOLPN|nr:uncharacterized protein LOC107030248 [Solanum pennellii]